VSGSTCRTTPGSHKGIAVIRRQLASCRFLWGRAVTVAGVLTLAASVTTVPAGLASAGHAGMGRGHPAVAAAKVTRGTKGAGPGAVMPVRPPVLDWPKVGQAAVELRGVGLVGRSPRERPVPIASLTKMMTALILLHDHPLVPGESGPRFRITAADVASYDKEAVAGDSTVEVVAGEILTEYQFLEALLVPSGDNFADMIATWDAGSISRFVAKMNAMARSLGLFATHYADASGVNPASVSTASDQARLAADLMGDAVVRGIVRRPYLRFPVVRKIWNANPALGVDGIIGVKSGWTFEASGCLVTAAFRTVRHHGVLVIVAALGQPGGLWYAATVDEALLEATTRALTG